MEHVYPPESEGDKIEDDQRSWERKRRTRVDHLELRVVSAAERLTDMIAAQAPTVIIEGTQIPALERAVADLIARARGRV